MTTDKTTKTGQDNTSGKTGQSSGSKSGSTSKAKGKLYTDDAIVKIKSDAAAEAGRLRKAAEQERDAFKQDLESSKSRLDTLEREMNESRLAEAGDDTDKLRVYRGEQALTKQKRDADERDRDLTRREGQLKTDRTDLDKDKGVVNIAYTAAKHGLKVEDLESLGITDQEQLEKVAVKLAAGKDNGEDANRQAYQALETDKEREAFLEAHPDLTKEAAEFKPDSGDGTGQGELTDQQRLDQRYPTMKTK